MIEDHSYAAWHGWQPMGYFLAGASWEQLVVEGKGIRVRDRGGRWYLDARSCLWHATLGYGHEGVENAIRRQLATLPIATGLAYGRPAAVTIEYANALAARLPEGLRRIRFANSGSQIVEMAVMVSRYHRRLSGDPQRTNVIALWQSYHGAGPGASALTGSLLYHMNSGPLAGDVHHAAPPSSSDETRADAVRAKVEELGADSVTAVMVEPVLGNLGLALSPGYLRDLAALCAETGIHLILDEVSTGFGRVGALSRGLDVGVRPDMLLFGKGITAGYLPFAAMAVSERIYRDAFTPRDGVPFLHGSTSDGHPLGASAGLAVLEALDEDDLLAGATARGELLRSVLRATGERHAVVAGVDGVGMMVRVLVAKDDGTPLDPGEQVAIPQGEVPTLHRRCEQAGLLVSMGPNCLILAPPLVTTEDECLEIADLLDRALAD
jgi:adenosylmethionine-8-amino-7-oxononanoate aminotransferase